MQMCYKIGGHELLQKWMSNSEIYLSIYFEQKSLQKKFDLLHGQFQQVTGGQIEQNLDWT